MFDLAGALASFGGGVFGAAIGGLFSSVLTGLVVIAGVAASYFQDLSPAQAMISQVAFGPWLGPHIAFAGSVAAACYAAKKRLLKTGKDIVTPLAKFNDPGVLAVGGVFGVLGYVIEGWFTALNLPTDTVFLTVVVSGIIARWLILAEGPLGTLPPELEKEAGAGNLWGRFIVTDTHVWLPYQKDLPQLLILGFGIGAASAAATLYTGSSVIGFGITAFALIFFINLGGAPVGHHIALLAAVAADLTANVLIGALWGILGALIGELAARLFLNWGESHIDPPATAITVCTTLALLLMG
ncbi:MAG: hypothetical protein GX062_04375 [Firmicutes bacterium]|jgi:hypothetical protein|nr:hypothetical protein [Bacillota bacterium]